MKETATFSSSFVPVSTKEAVWEQGVATAAIPTMGGIASLSFANKAD
jgi:hypothetical protein